MKKSEERLRSFGERLEIPQSLKPEAMKEILEEQDRKQFFRRGKLYPALAAAACFCILGAGLLHLQQQGLLLSLKDTSMQAEEFAAAEDSESFGEAGVYLTDAEEAEAKADALDLPVLTYEEIYEKMSPNWVEYEILEEPTSGAVTEDAVVEEFAAAESLLRDEQKNALEESAAFGKTNVQVETIDEADRIKNDGRYLYQIVYKEEETGAKKGSDCGIQIVDTRDGLKEAAFVDGFEGVEEFYVWEDLLITIEKKYMEVSAVTPLTDGSSGAMAVCDLLSLGKQYHEIKVFDISDRTKPEEVKTFTMQGDYETSRIADGYFYGISRFWAEKGEGVQDYEAYIPRVDGKLMSAERIYCPAYEEGTQYLVVVSIDLQNPTEIKDSRAVLSDSGVYYMSTRNLYLTSYQSVWAQVPEEEGLFTENTRIVKFTYLNGTIYAQAEGTVPGELDSSFSLDEYNGNLRAVSTVREYEVKKVVDDRTGELLGYDEIRSSQTNALYVLNRELTVIGKIEDLAEDEEIYSARFLGDTGYFVTFRQTDPLFAVDLSDPTNPKVLGELKVSGFSEYLHIWGDGLLLGIGMEADEETGQTQGMKLSMFDTSDPANLSEISRKVLEDYNYSEALYDHKAILVDVGENLIGFCAEGSNRGKYWREYLVYSYESREFVQNMKLETKSEDGGYYGTRGTFIGDVFYLLSEDGSVEAYDRSTGRLLESLSK